MVTTTLVLGLAVLLAALIWKIALRPGPAISTPKEWERRKLWANAKSFALLIDKEGEAYLKRSLPRHLFSVIQRKRTMLAKECAERIGKNAAMLLQLAQRAESSPDPRVAAAARQLSSMAVRVRINALLAVWCLRMKWIFPAADIRVPSRYLAYNHLMETTLTSLTDGQSAAWLSDIPVLRP